MIKKRIIGILLILIGIALAVFFNQFKSKYGFVDFRFYEYWIYFHYGYAFAIGIFLILIGTGLLMFSYSRKEIKKTWKEHKGFLIPLFLVNIIAVFLLLTIKQHVKVNNILHVIALITLVFVTWNYAKQTQNLVAQEKISQEEEKKKRYAEFGEKRIEKFLIPLLEKLEILVKSLHKMKFDMQNANEIRDMEIKFNDFDNFRSKNSYLATRSLTQELIQFRRQIKKDWIAGSAIRKVNDRINWRDGFLMWTNQTILSANKEFRGIMIHLRKTYGYFSGEEVNHGNL